MKLITALKIKAIKFFRKRHFSNKPVEFVFEKIYAQNLWTSAETVSGPGSELKSTKQLRDGLEELLNRYSIKSILDCGCGDFNWMKELELKGIQYTGIDIVEELIEKNKTKYSKPNVIFLHGNIIADKLPAADLLMCRDVLVHLTNEQITKALTNFFQSQSRYLLMTSFTGVENKNTFTGDWRPINLQAAPFHFPKPTAIIYETVFLPDSKIKKQVCLWERESLVGNFS